MGDIGNVVDFDVDCVVDDADFVVVAVDFVVGNEIAYSLIVDKIR